MPIVDLIEHQPRELPPGALTPDEALKLHSDKRFNLEFPSPANGGNYVLTSSGWVGHIPLNANTAVRIAPKVPVAHVFQMLEVAYRLKSFRFLEGTTAIESIEELYTSLASILAQRVLDRSRKGLHRAYLDRQADLSTVRGRIDLRSNIGNLVRGRAQVACRYHELTSDLEDNQILLWALMTASRMPLTREDVRVQVRRAVRALRGTITVREISPAACVGRFYSRLNSDYLPLHGLARFLLEQSSPSLREGDHVFLPFQIDMARLFELFVAEWLRSNGPSNTSWVAKHTVHLQGDGHFSFEMDLVRYDRRSRRPVAVLDTKYKAGAAPTEIDIKQVVAYAVELGVTSAVLVYPSQQTKAVTIMVGPIRVSTAVFDLAKPLEQGGEAFLTQLLVGQPAGADEASSSGEIASTAS